MKNVLIIGSTGQIGSELTMKLRGLYNGNIVAGYIPGAEPTGELKESGPSAIVDVTNEQQIAEAVSKYKIDTIYNLAALLSAVAESKPQMAWKIGMGGLFNVLEVARTMHCAVFTPSSIGVFGDDTPKDKTPQDTIRNPRTMYGVTKVSGELLSDYYHNRFGVDTRSVRFPGLISYVTPPGGGTTDYAVDIYYSAVKGETFKCPIAAGTYMDMMYMPDALRAAIEIMEADPDKFVHRNSFNIASMSFEPDTIYNKIKEYIPEFKMVYEVDPLRQAIAESWPNSLDDTCARQEWGWKPEYDLDAMTKDMIEKLRIRFGKSDAPSACNQCQESVLTLYRSSLIYQADLSVSPIVPARLFRHIGSHATRQTHKPPKKNSSNRPLIIQRQPINIFKTYKDTGWMCITYPFHLPATGSQSASRIIQSPANCLQSLQQA